MRKKRFTEEQITLALRQGVVSAPDRPDGPGAPSHARFKQLRSETPTAPFGSQSIRPS